MIEKLLLKTDVDKTFNKYKENFNIFAPIKENGNIVFRKICDPENVELNYLNSKIPPKSVIFPKIETLFKFRQNGDGIEIKKPQPVNKKSIIFGIRPCDADSFQMLKKFFGFGKFKDEIFLEKVSNTILVGIGCNSPRNTCFCTSVSGNPFKKDHLDIFLTDLGEKYLVQSITKDGEELLEDLDFLTPPTEEDLKKAMKLKDQAELLISSKLELKDIDQALYKNYEHGIWTEISQNCIGCGTCSYLCPTCHCFDVIDEVDHYNKKGRRIRIWDTCQYSFFTRETSGHNPRPKRKQRVRQRIMHKFCYYPRNYDTFGCVGCGRCIIYCPINNDIRKILPKFNEVEKEEEEIVVA